MIDDATLAAWEQLPEGDAHDLWGALGLAIAEIRRLRALAPTPVMAGWKVEEERG